MTITSKPQPRCHSCAGARFERLLELGPVPIAHRFLKKPAGPDEYRHEMSLDVCLGCGLAQILDPVPPEELYRDYNFCFSTWKAQPHMADEISLIRERVTSAEPIVEIGSNDGSFLRQLAAAGFTALSGIEPNPAANELARKSGASIHEGFFNDDMAGRVLAERGPASLVVSRQAVEHIIPLEQLASGLRRLLKPDGWLMIEVPDLEVPARYGDVSALWEEHVNYFTEATLGDWMRRAGFQPKLVRRYDFSGGGFMILAQRAEPTSSGQAQAASAGQATARDFARRAAGFREKIEARLRANRAQGRANFLYGTGCRSNMLINAFKLQSYFDLLIDDQKEKQGLFLPGTALRIESSAALARAPGDCFLAVNSENEPAVIGRHGDFVRQGGRFLSLHSPSTLLVELDIADAAVR